MFLIDEKICTSTDLHDTTPDSSADKTKQTCVDLYHMQIMFIIHSMCA